MVSVVKGRLKANRGLGCSIRSRTLACCRVRARGLGSGTEWMMWTRLVGVWGFIARKGAESENFGVSPVLCCPPPQTLLAGYFPPRASYILGGTKQGTGWGRWQCRVPLTSSGQGPGVVALSHQNWVWKAERSQTLSFNSTQA